MRRQSLESNRRRREPDYWFPPTPDYHSNIRNRNYGGFVSSTTQTSLTGDNSAYLTGIRMADGRVFCAPLNATNGVIYNPLNNTTTTTTVTGGNSAYGGAVLLENGQIFLAPLNAANGVIYNPVTNSVFVTTVVGGNAAYLGSTLLPDGNVFLCPLNAANAIIYNPNTNIARTAFSLAGSSKFVGCQLLFDNTVFCAPFGANNALIYRLNDGTTETISSAVIPVDAWGAYGGCCLLQDGRVFLTRNRRDSCIYNPVTKTAQTFGLGIVNECRQPLLLPDGKVWITSLVAPTHFIFNPNASTVTTVSSAGSSLFHGATLLNDGRVFCPPFNAANGVIYGVVNSTSLPDSRCLNPYDNHF